jgi:hypothetical protein
MIPVAMSTLIFSQNLGAAVFLCIANTLFLNRLRSVISQDAPFLDIEKVIAAGGSAVGVRDLVDLNPGLDLRILQNAFSKGVDRVFQFFAGVAGVQVLLSFGMGMRTKVEEQKKGTEQAGREEKA